MLHILTQKPRIRLERDKKVEQAVFKKNKFPIAKNCGAVLDDRCVVTSTSYVYLRYITTVFIKIN